MASRRDLSNSQERAYSDASSRTARQVLDATGLELMTDSAILQQCLNLNSIISTVSSFSRRFQDARSRPELQQINQIGVGLQGAVFEQVGKPLALKKETPGNETLFSNLRHEYKIHCDVSAAFEHYQTSNNSEIHVPKPFEFISKTQKRAFWDELLPKMPQAYRTRGDVVAMERILPLPKNVRKALITQFCGREQHLDTADIDSLLNDPSNKHCLARVYLGKANGPINIDHEAPLRNFPLYLRFMEDIGIDTLTLANAMGKAYAILHWGAAINGDDVEIVLGTSAIEAKRAAEQEPPGFQYSAVGLYLLDFGQCEAVDLNRDCDVVYQAFKGAMVTGDNQYFIPHCSTSPALFAAFKRGYIDAGNIVLSDKQLNDKFNIEEFMQKYGEYAEDFAY